MFWGRSDISQPVLTGLLECSLRILNPGLPEYVYMAALKKIIKTPRWELPILNEYFHKMFLDGVTVNTRPGEPCRRYKLKLCDSRRTGLNDWLAVESFHLEGTGKTGKHIIDLILFINGLPLVVFFFQEPGTESPGDLYPAYLRLQEFKKKIPRLFAYNALVVLTDGYHARAGCYSTSYNRFMPWRCYTPAFAVPPGINQLRALIIGMLDKKILLDIIRHFIVFSKTKKPVKGSAEVALQIEKKLAVYHQYCAVTHAVDATVRAVSPGGDRRCGVVWHTQGSGKSLIMIFYAAKLAMTPELENPTIIVITDRSDLDNQLFDSFAASVQLLHQSPLQARSRGHLKQLLNRVSGGIIFTTLQKFLPRSEFRQPLLSCRRNIIVIADEAHRSQYDFVDGLALHLRNALPFAAFTGFTGTPLERNDRNTAAVFGDYIDIYDMEDAVSDGVTVEIYYESRMIEKDAGGGGRGRLKAVATDIVSHFEERREQIPGKAMVVTDSRRICVELYNEIIRLRPHWHGETDREGQVKVVMTGNRGDPHGWQPHIRDREQRRVVAERLKNPGDSLQMVIVCDMWLTGFDAPCLHTMYIDKPMKEHLLVQAIARINRVFPGKTSGLVVDYTGIAHHLHDALSLYMNYRKRDFPIRDLSEAAVSFREEFENFARWLDDIPYHSYLMAHIHGRDSGIINMQEDILARDGGKEIFLSTVSRLLGKFKRAVPHPDTMELKQEILFFRIIYRRLNTFDTGGPGDEREGIMKKIANQFFSQSFAGGKGDRPVKLHEIGTHGISLSAGNLHRQLCRSEHPHVAIEVLSRLLREEIHRRSRGDRNFGDSYLQLLKEILRQYREKQTGTAPVIEALLELARKLCREDSKPGKVSLTPDEYILYRTLSADEAAENRFPEKTIRSLARELTGEIKANATIDLSIRASARARLKVAVKRTLRRYDFPMETTATAVRTLMEQAAQMAESYCQR